MLHPLLLLALVAGTLLLLLLLDALLLLALFGGIPLLMLLPLLLLGPLLLLALIGAALVLLPSLVLLPAPLLLVLLLRGLAFPFLPWLCLGGLEAACGQNQTRNDRDSFELHCPCLRYDVPSRWDRERRGPNGRMRPPGSMACVPGAWILTEDQSLGLH
jgi:hypothetical protein